MTPVVFSNTALDQGQQGRDVPGLFPLAHQPMAMRTVSAVVICAVS